VRLAREGIIATLTISDKRIISTVSQTPDPISGIEHAARTDWNEFPMKMAEINGTFLARNVYRRWQRVIGRAKTDITIFTPYFDHTLLRLLKANVAVERDQVTIVTDLSPDNALEMPYQLRAAKTALSQGISVRSLQGLHAKVLLVDGSHTSIGSQNFTSRGQRNKEASVLPATMLGNSQFVQTLHEWRLGAREVTEDEIDELLRQLTPYFRMHKKMHDAIEAKVTEVLVKQEQKRDALLHKHGKELEEQERKKNILLSEHLPELEQQSLIRLAQREVFAKLTEHNGYDTLKVTKGGDLINRESRNPDGSFSPLSLHRLYMYPIIFADTNRMGFARMGKTQITYIRSQVEWTDTQWMVGDVAADVSITFLDTKTESHNIEAKVTNPDHGSCTFGVSFNGKSVEIRERRFLKGNRASQSDYDIFVLNITRTLLDSKDALDEFFKYYLSPFKYADKKLDEKNAEMYFERLWYRTSLIQVQGNSLLVFAKCRHGPFLGSGSV